MPSDYYFKIMANTDSYIYIYIIVYKCLNGWLNIAEGGESCRMTLREVLCCVLLLITHVCFPLRHPTPVLLPGKSQGRRSLVGCSPGGRWGSDTTERLHFHFSLSCIGEGNGNPLQCSCLENPRAAGPGGLLSMGSHRVGHDWSDLAAAAVFHYSQL